MGFRSREHVERQRRASGPSPAPSPQASFRRTPLPGGPAGGAVSRKTPPTGECAERAEQSRSTLKEVESCLQVNYSPLTSLLGALVSDFH